jgi:tRNA-binding protein
MSNARIEDFLRLDIRVGTVIAAAAFATTAIPDGPSVGLTIDFGPTIGPRRAAAQLQPHYRPDQLIGRQVLAVLNLPPGQIGDFVNEALVLGVPDEDGALVLIRPDFPVPPGGRLF